MNQKQPKRNGSTTSLYLMSATKKELLELCKFHKTSRSRLIERLITEAYIKTIHKNGE